jgi:transcriptional antiterminator Rof (Rho-off)
VVLARHLTDDDPESKVMRTLAQDLLKRKAYEYIAVTAAREVLLKEALRRKGFSENTEFAVVRLKTTAYKEGENEVFVVTAAGAQPVSDHSFIITSMQDRAESESLIMLLDADRKADFRAAASSVGATTAA